MGEVLNLKTIYLAEELVSMEIKIEPEERLQVMLHHFHQPIHNGCLSITTLQGCGYGCKGRCVVPGFIDYISNPVISDCNHERIGER